MLNNQSIAEMTLEDLESLINRIVYQKINQILTAKDKEIEKAEIEKQKVIQELIEIKSKIPNKNLENSNPFVEFAGIFKDDPFFDEFVEEMAKNRRELDAEMAAYEASLEENQTA
jgi:DNA repair exonuclease SbcCD nuclease subunit